jgi:hypothetical protein
MDAVDGEEDAPEARRDVEALGVDERHGRNIA